MENSEIIKAIRSGDKDVIRDVYKDNAKDVYSFAKSITGDHDSAMNATKRTFVNLFTNIQKGEEPANIRLAALKLAYDEACRIAMPSTENIDSPFDKQEEPEAAEVEEAASEVPQTDSDIERTASVVGDGIVDTPEEMNEVMDGEEFNYDENAEEEVPEEEQDASEEEDTFAGEESSVEEAADDVAERSRDDEASIGNTQVFNIKEAMADEDAEIEMDEEYEDDDYDDEYYDDEDEYDEAPRSKAATVIIIIINVILALILIWLLYGLLVSFGVISDIIHLGFTYTFFNEHIYPIF